MLLRIDDFTELNLKIEGYQFPNLGTEPWDADWLNVNIHVIHPKRDWKATEPCLMTFELKWLIEWLEKISDEKEVEVHLNFTEPELEFEIIKENGEKKLRVVLSYGLAPPWINNIEEEFYIDFIVTQKDLKRIAKDLRKELEAFPIRVGLQNG
jgi:hypothetical protein